MGCVYSIVDHHWKGEKQLVRPAKASSSKPTTQARSRNSGWEGTCQEQKKGKNVQPSSHSTDFIPYAKKRRNKHISSKKKKASVRHN